MLAIPAPEPTFEQIVEPFFAKRCYSCHNSRGNSGGLNLQELNTAKSVAENRDEWERILRRISAGDMPPRQMPRPDADELKQVESAIRNEFELLDRSAEHNPKSGAVLL